jgi:membrane protein required for colicin V production
MSNFDLALMVVFVFFVVLGLYRGFIKESLSLAAWVLAAAAAWMLADRVGALLKPVIAEQTVQVIAGFVLIFLVVFVSTAIAKHYLHQYFMSRVYLKVPNYIFGAVIGGLRGGFVIVLVFLIAGLTSLPAQRWWKQSQLAPHIEPVAMRVAKYLPQDVARHIRYS